jgi:hypothetical protein
VSGWNPHEQTVDKRTEISSFVIPAKAGIQDVDETIDCDSWTPTFAGVTNSFSAAG